MAESDDEAWIVAECVAEPTTDIADARLLDESGELERMSASLEIDPPAPGAALSSASRPSNTPGYLKLPLGGVAIAAGALALTCLAALVVVASLKHAETLSTVALALAVVTFVAQLIVFVVQAGAANQQMLQSRALHADQLQLLGEMGERARGTDATVTRIDERLLEVALGKTLGERDKTGADARSIAMEVTALLNAEEDAPSLRRARMPRETRAPRALEMQDADANRRARERLEAFPDENVEAAIATLEALSPDALAALTRWGRDEIQYAGTNYLTGLGVSDGPRREVLDAGLVCPRGPSSGLYVLTDRGRDAASVLIAPGDPPPDLAEAIYRLRSNVN